MNGAFKDTTHNCWQCKYSWLGRCMHEINYGMAIDEERVCLEFTDGREPSRVTFKTVGQLENYLRAYFYNKDFVEEFTRKQLANMLNILYKHQYFGIKMSKSRMVKHIELYIKLHNLKCEH